MTDYKPHVKTKIGWGRLWQIDTSKVVVEFDYMYLVELATDDIDWSTVPEQYHPTDRPPEGVEYNMTDSYKEDYVVEDTVDKVFEYAKKPANPYSYLYNNPRAITTPQYFAHWTQRYQNHRMYMVLVRAAKITGYEPVPAPLLYRNHKRDGFAGRRVQIGDLSFYLIKTEEMSAGLRRRYEKFKDMLRDDIKKDIENYKDSRQKETVKDLFDIRA